MHALSRTLHISRFTVEALAKGPKNSDGIQQSIFNPTIVCQMLANQNRGRLRYFNVKEDRSEQLSAPILASNPSYASRRTIDTDTCIHSPFVNVTMLRPFLYPRNLLCGATDAPGNFVVRRAALAILSQLRPEDQVELSVPLFAPSLHPLFLTHPAV